MVGASEETLRGEKSLILRPGTSIMVGESSGGMVPGDELSPGAGTLIPAPPILSPRSRPFSSIKKQVALGRVLATPRILTACFGTIEPGCQFTPCLTGVYNARG